MTAQIENMASRDAVPNCSRAPISPEQRCVLISEAAYYLAEQRGFEPGHDLEDWLAAENEIDAMLLQDEAPDAELT